MQGMTQLKQKDDVRQHIATPEKQELAIRNEGDGLISRK